MPNWVTNQVVITGSKDCIDELFAVISIDDDVYFLANTLPTPKEFDGNT